MSDSTEALQARVQQKLGRCMIRLQEYEGQLKAMLVGMSAKGQPAALEADRSRRASSIQGKSLGHLVGLFIADHLVSEAEEAQADENCASVSRKSPDGSSVSMNFQIVLSSEHHVRIKEGLARMIAMRNELVHHLLEQFDLSGEDGCATACDHLDACHDEVVRQLGALRAWAKGITELATTVSSVLESRLSKMILEDMGNTRSTALHVSGAIRILKEAEVKCSKDGWTLLDAAVKHLAIMNKDESPRRYGCRNWRQVLARSESFEVRSDAGGDDGRGRTWYRSRTERCRTGEKDKA